MDDPNTTPMFPLGSVLLPTMLVPLHIFEPRYRQFIADVLDGENTFGTVMIERGSEVGGSDVRATIGCRAQILEAEEQTDGRWYVVAVGTERIGIDRWLDDDPYPRAITHDLADLEPTETGSDSDLTADPRWLELDSQFRDLLRVDQASAVGSVPPAIELADNPAESTFQMASVAPISTLDRYRVLCARTPELRRIALIEAFSDATILVKNRRNN